MEREILKGMVSSRVRRGLPAPHSRKPCIYDDYHALRIPLLQEEHGISGNGSKTASRVVQSGQCSKFICCSRLIQL
jgi:hypothetical protein